MKRIILAAAIVLCVGTHAYASPFLVCDPPTQQEVDFYIVSGLEGSGVDGSNVPKDSSGEFGIKLDLATINPGSYVATAVACSTMWGVCSGNSNPCAFVRPAALTAPTNYRLSK